MVMSLWPHFLVDPVNMTLNSSIRPYIPEVNWNNGFQTFLTTDPYSPQA